LPGARQHQGTGQARLGATARPRKGRRLDNGMVRCCLARWRDRRDGRGQCPDRQVPGPGRPDRSGGGLKTVILAGGRGTRISEETDPRPKPMVTIGGRPLLWHIMSIYSRYGFHEFIICLGYKGYVIKEYFANY